MTMMIMIKSSRPRRDPAKAGTFNSLSSSCDDGEGDWLWDSDGVGLSDSLVIDSELEPDSDGSDSLEECVSDGSVLVSVGALVGVKMSEAVNVSVGKSALQSSRLSTSYLMVWVS